MFDSTDFPKPLDEELFDTWLEEGRANKFGFSYLLVIWDEFESEYRPVYAEELDEVRAYQRYESSNERESLVAAYDLYSQSKIGAC